MGFKLEADTVRKIAMSLVKENSSFAWECDKPDDVGYIKVAMYNAGVTDLAEEIIAAIEELKKA